MAFPTIATASLAYQRPASFQYVYVRPSGELYQTLGALQDAQLMFEEYVEQDSLGKNKSFAYEFTASCKLMQAGLTVLELLDSLSAGGHSFLFKMHDAASIPTGGSAATEGWILLTAAQIGAPKCTIMYDGPANQKVYVLVEWRGSLLRSEIDAAVKAAIDDNEFEATGGSGTFKGIGVYTAALDGGLPDVTQILGAGVSSITLADTGGAAQTLGPVKNFKLKMEMVDDDEDDRRRYQPFAVDVDMSYEWMETDAANLLNLDAFADSEIDAVVTMRNGLIFTFSNKLGIDCAYVVGTDLKKKKVIRFRHRGQILKTALDGIVSTA